MLTQREDGGRGLLAGEALVPGIRVLIAAARIDFSQKGILKTVGIDDPKQNQYTFPVLPTLF